MIYYQPEKHSIETEQINKTKTVIPKIYIDIDTLSKIQTIVDLSPLEVSWFSRVTKKANRYYIQDAFIINQTVSAVETEMTLSGLSDFMTEIINEHGIEFYNSIRCWGHSHVNMSTNPSVQDLTQIKEFNNQDFYIMLIANKHNEFTIRLYDFAQNTIYKNLPLHLKSTVENEDEINTELKAKVKDMYAAKKIIPTVRTFGEGYCRADDGYYKIHGVSKDFNNGCAKVEGYYNDLPSLKEIKNSKASSSKQKNIVINKKDYECWTNPITEVEWRFSKKQGANISKKSKKDSFVRYAPKSLSSPEISSIIQNILSLKDFENTLNTLTFKYPHDLGYTLDELLEMDIVEIDDIFQEYPKDPDREQFRLFLNDVLFNECLRNTLYESFSDYDWRVGDVYSSVFRNEYINGLYGQYGDSIDDAIESVNIQEEREAAKWTEQDK